MGIRMSLDRKERKWGGRAVALVAASLLVGCSSTGLVHFDQPRDEELRAQRLEFQLDRYAREFAEVVVLAADEIVSSTPDLETKRAAVRWKLMTIPRVNDLNRNQVRQADALLGLWFYTEAMLRHYETGAGRDRFGAAQPIAVAASRELLGEIEQIARQALDSEEDFLAAREAVRDFSRQYAPREVGGGADDYLTVEAGIQALKEGAGALEWLPSFSLERLNPFSGLNESAAAIRHLTDETNALIEDVYTGLPWRIELLLYNMEALETVRDTRANLATFSDSAASIAEAVDRLPADMKGVVAAALDEVDAKQEGLQTTLQQTEDTLVRAEAVVSGLSETAAYLTEAGKAWDSTFRTLGLGEEEGDSAVASEDAADRSMQSEGKGRPFDILEYRDTAEELRNVAVELRGLVQDVHGLTDTTDEDAPLRNVELAAEAAATAALGPSRDLVDYAALRLLQLVAAILVAALLYRFIAPRLAPRTPQPGS